MTIIKDGHKEYRETKNGITTLYVSGPHGIKRVIIPVQDTADRTQESLANRLEKEMIRSVTHGYKERITINGVGYKAQINGEQLELNLGYKVPIKVRIPSNIKLLVKNSGLLIEGWSASYGALRQFLSTIVEIKPAAKDKYTQKGMRLGSASTLSIKK